MFVCGAQALVHAPSSFSANISGCNVAILNKIETHDAFDDGLNLNVCGVSLFGMSLYLVKAGQLVLHQDIYISLAFAKVQA